MVMGMWLGMWMGCSEPCPVIPLRTEPTFGYPPTSVRDVIQAYSCGAPPLHLPPTNLWVECHGHIFHRTAPFPPTPVRGGILCTVQLRVCALSSPCAASQGVLTPRLVITPGSVCTHPRPLPRSPVPLAHSPCSPPSVSLVVAGISEGGAENADAMQEGSFPQFADDLGVCALPAQHRPPPFRACSCHL